MNPLLDVLLTHGLFVDALGILGLGLVGMGAARLARSHGSRGLVWIAAGAVSLLAARLYFLTSPHFMTMGFEETIGPAGIAATIAIPPLLLFFGLAAVVGGFWRYEKDLTGETR